MKVINLYQVSFRGLNEGVVNVKVQASDIFEAMGKVSQTFKDFAKFYSFSWYDEQEDKQVTVEGLEFTNVIKLCQVSVEVEPEVKVNEKVRPKREINSVNFSNGSTKYSKEELEEAIKKYQDKYTHQVGTLKLRFDHKDVVATLRMLDKLVYTYSRVLDNK